MAYIPVKIDKRKGPKPERVKQFCPKGHDKNIVGKDKKNSCSQCKKEWRSSSKNQFCSKGHDTFVTGRYKNGHCVECKKEWSKEYVIISQPQFCIHGHDTFVVGRQKKGLCKGCAKERKAKSRLVTNLNSNKRWSNDISYKLKKILRSRIKSALRENWKVGSAVKDLGCTVEHFKQYIETQFYDGMTWNNLGTFWELDHIKSLWRFDLTEPIQFKQAAHYTNLQPLTIEDHRKKSAKDLSDWHKKFHK